MELFLNTDPIEYLWFMNNEFEYKITPLTSVLPRNRKIDSERVQNPMGGVAKSKSSV